ncbi:uncharacterized protein LOC129600764 [Paramacrobiotus metropolitanus]|uniref:uncharacterized protein LOC129600764 n=1 Tax=Paramacrobiotus metropolitanus TaxID=2943436 RepID=UPI002445A036|nr:uncharacterized protein LOC129600764 [Paramacrobiotus metropolitanus]
MISTVFCLLLVVLVSAIGSVSIPADWRRYISPDVLKTSNTHSNKALYANDYFEGDIIGFENSMTENELSKAVDNTINDERFKWTGGSIPYKIAADIQRGNAFKPEEMEAIQRAMLSITILTQNCIQFVEQTNENDYISFLPKSSRCASSIGRQGGKQSIYLAPGCMATDGDIQHEILHALGLSHEQARLDRDEHVNVNWDNIPPSDRDQFKKYNSQTFGLPYDYQSVMHFKYNAFAKSASAPTIIPKKLAAALGQSTNLSPLDVVKLERHFGCPIVNSTQLIAQTQKRFSGSAEKSVRDDDAELYPAFLNTRLSQLECQELFTDRCQPPGDKDNCSAVDTSVLEISCSWELSLLELRGLLQNLAGFGMRQIIVDLPDKIYITANLWSPVRPQIVVYQTYNCSSAETTAKVSGMSSLLSLYLKYCDGLVIQKTHFQGTPKLRWVRMVYSSIAALEKGTFLNLLDLRLLSLEISFFYTPFTETGRAFIGRLHCQTELAWYRRFLQRNPVLLAAKLPGEVYHVNERWQSVGLGKSEIYYPVDCSKEIPLNHSAVNFNIEAYSLNDNLKYNVMPRDLEQHGRENFKEKIAAQPVNAYDDNVPET